MSSTRFRTESRSGRAAALIGLALGCALPAGFAQAPKSVKGDSYLYLGTYTRQKSKGIYAWRLHTADGSLQSIGLAAEISNPSFLAVSPDGRFLYAADENSAGIECCDCGREVFS